jgi:hypothetical protein
MSLVLFSEALLVSHPWRFFFAAVVFMAASSLAFARKPDTGFLDRTISLHNATYKYQVFLPEDWASNKKWPIILFLHGAGERGSDGLLQTQLGIGTAVRKDRTRFAAIIIMPQRKKDLWWKRTYLTWPSMGGYGTWAITAQIPINSRPSCRPAVLSSYPSTFVNNILT